MAQAITGRVTDQNGAGVADVVVRAVDNAKQTTDSAPSAANGDYSIDTLEAGTYTVMVTGGDAALYVEANNVQVGDAADTTGINFSKDPILDYLERIDDARFSIESPISIEEAKQAVALFSIASLMLAGRQEAATNGRVDVLGMISLHDGLQDRAFLDRLKVPQSAEFWADLTPKINDLFRTLDQQQSEVRQLASEAKRQFNLGTSNGVLANVRFPALFKRYVEIGVDPLLTLDLKAEAANANADRTKLVQADKLLEELKGVILQIVRSLSEFGTVGTRQLNADWAGFETRALEVLAELAQNRVDPGDVDSLSQWAVLADITGTDREQATAPYVALARHGHRLLRLALDVYDKTKDELERFDTQHLRNLFQEGNDASTFFTTLIAHEATTVNRYPLRPWMVTA
jgi:hypothetical protein